MKLNTMRKTVFLVGVLAAARAAAVEPLPVASASSDHAPQFVQADQGPIGSGDKKIVCILCMAGALVGGAGSIAGLFTLALIAPGPLLACGAACYSAFS